jgi:phospholipid/cholesterol/gamma-HCH transport system permease protein
VIGVIEALGNYVLQVLADLGGSARIAVAGFIRLPSRPFEARITAREITMIGFESTGVIAVLGMFTGMVLVVTVGQALERFGSERLVSEGVALAMVRELGPVLTGFLLAGRVGSGIAAEIGSMQISEQIDAMRSLGADPIKKLVVPKLMAAIISMPLLTVVANAIGVLGGMGMAFMMLGVAPNEFLFRAINIIRLSDFATGVLKTCVFGAIIASVGSYYGFATTGGTVGVGKSATRSVVLSCILILVADLFIASSVIAVKAILHGS